jgi:hypothetical protein
MAYKFNPFTDTLDIVGSGGASYIDGVVADSSLLPVTLGTPALDAVYLAKAGSGVWLISRKPAGLYVRVANNGVAADWTYLGAFPEVNSSANWSLYDGTTPSKELKFDLSAISNSTVRTLTAPNASGRIQIEGQPIGNTTPSTGAFTTLSAAPTSGSALTLTGGTVTASAPLIDASQTWNAGGTTFTGLAATITNTASATGSLVARLTVGSTNVFETDVRGFTTLRKVATTTDFVNVFIVRRGTTEVFAVRDDGAVNAVAFSCPAGGAGHSSMNADGFAVRSTGSFRISSDVAAFSPDVYLRRDAAGVFAQYNGTNAQEYRVYGTYTSATNYQRLAIKTKSITLSALSGASVATTGGFIPDGAVLVGLTTRVSTAITGATGYDIGDGSDADRWGANVGIALNTSSDNRDWTAGTIECFTAAQEVTLTAVGSNFTGGAVVIVAHYLAGEAD